MTKILTVFPTSVGKNGFLKEYSYETYVRKITVLITSTDETDFNISPTLHRNDILLNEKYIYIVYTRV